MIEPTWKDGGVFGYRFELLGAQAAKIDLSVKQRLIVERLARSKTEAQRLVERAQIVLRSANGELCVDQARALGIDAQRVRRWRKRFARKALLTDESHRIRFVFTPKHCSWMNQIEIWFSILSRRLLGRSSFASIEERSATSGDVYPHPGVRNLTLTPPARAGPSCGPSP